LDRSMPKYIRRGVCNQCGDCCRPRFPISEEAAEFYRENGLPEDGHCQYQRFVDGKGLCTIHAERADHCIRFPWHPDQIRDLPRCSYRFEVISD